MNIIVVPSGYNTYFIHEFYCKITMIFVELITFEDLSHEVFDGEGDTASLVDTYKIKTIGTVVVHSRVVGRVNHTIGIEDIVSAV